MIDVLSGRYGRRGAWLVILGCVWVVFGLGVLLEPTPARPWVLFEYLPTWFNALGWGVTGVVAIWQGLRGPDNSDWPGHVALYLMPAVRVMCFTFSWLLWAGSSILAALGFTHDVIGWSGGWFAALVWSLVSVMLRLIADWPNPVQPIPRPPAHALET